MKTFRCTTLMIMTVAVHLCLIEANKFNILGTLGFDFIKSMQELRADIPPPKFPIDLIKKVEDNLLTKKHNTDDRAITDHSRDVRVGAVTEAEGVQAQSQSGLSETNKKVASMKRDLFCGLFDSKKANDIKIKSNPKKANELSLSHSKDRDFIIDRAEKKLKLIKDFNQNQNLKILNAINLIDQEIFFNRTNVDVFSQLFLSHLEKQKKKLKETRAMLINLQNKLTKEDQKAEFYFQSLQTVLKCEDCKNSFKKLNETNNDDPLVPFSFAAEDSMANVACERAKAIEAGVQYISKLEIERADNAYNHAMSARNELKNHLLSLDDREAHETEEVQRVSASILIGNH